ncbi:M48 family metallopeptidase [Nitrosomonas sp.]|uniref:M48 family metallopeptidase n=1 Tax=Nitrosomonas sp. TaxID=42353 RepID=UPI00284CCDAF|nr:M48 family metallopeptidase [Nitrosomonas sp.]MDR4513608.1 M48 family metallopeptidase [Nitrosomonas sp.]
MKILFLAIVILLSSCASKSQIASEPQIVSEAQINTWTHEINKWIENSKRVSNIASKILIEGKEYCDKLDHIGPYFGIDFWSKDTFKKKWHTAALSSFGLNNEVQIHHVHPLSPAYDAGLQVGDKVVKINDLKIKDQSDYMSALKKNKAKTFMFTIRRKGEHLDVVIEPLMVCDSKVFLVYDDSRIFYSDGEYILISNGIMPFFSSDEEIALVISHELAHLARNHHTKNYARGWMGALLGFVFQGIIEALIGGELETFDDNAPSLEDHGEYLLSKASVEQEQQADYDGLHLMSMAGYEIDNLSSTAWNKLERIITIRHSEFFHYKHPKVEDRISRFETVKQEIKEKKQNGYSLIP